MFDLLKIFFIKKAMAENGNALPGGESAGGGITPGAESAGGGTLPGGSGFFKLPEGFPTDLGDFIANILTWVLWIATVVFIYIIIVAAWDLITKKESVTVRENAKKRLFNALIGFVLIMLAQSIPGIIRDILTG